MFVTDTLSRAPLPEATPEISANKLNAFLRSVITNAPMSDKRKAQFQEETFKDATLQSVKQYITSGWPEKSNLRDETKQFYSIRDELSINSDLILKGDRIVVPQSMRKEMLTILHIGHPGITKVKTRARSTLYWPGMNNQLDNLSRTCQQCQEYQNRQREEPALNHEIPETPWTKVGTDLFHLFNKTYLLVVDYTTNFFEISQLPDAESQTVVSHTKAIFARYGIPKEIVSDNGPEYSAKAYHNFCKDWDIHHNPSSPEYPKSNGLAERTVQTVKRTLKKAKKAGDDIHLTLLALRTTPCTNNRHSPADKMFNRSPRTLIPSINNTVSDKLTNSHPKLSKNQQHDYTTKRHILPELHPGDTVRIHDGKTWSRTGTVVSKANQPRSYNIKMNNRRTLRRNRQHILKTENSIESDSDSDDSSLIIDRQPTPEPELEYDSDATIPFMGDEEPVKSYTGRTRRPPKHLKDYITK